MWLREAETESITRRLVSRPSIMHKTSFSFERILSRSVLCVNGNFGERFTSC